MSLTTLANFGVKSELTTGGLPASLQHIEVLENISTRLGFQALEYNALGVLNTALGYQAVGSENAVSGDGLIAVGTQTLFNNNGNYNTAVGARAGFSNNTGSRNTYNGYNAGYFNRSGSDQTSIGYLAGGNTLGDRNVFVGSLAGSAESASSNNVGVGANANAVGGASIAVGADAVVSGRGSAAIGDSADVSGAHTFVVGANVTSAGAGSLILMPRKDGLPFTSTKAETLNIHGRLLGEREITGNYKVSLLGDRILLDNSYNRVHLESGGMSFYSDSAVTFLSPTNFVAPTNFVSGSANFNVPTSFDELTNINGPANLYNVQHANASNLFVTGTLVSSANSMFNSNVSLLGATFATDFTATKANVANAAVTALDCHDGDFEHLDAENAEVDKLLVTESARVVGAFTVSNVYAAAAITHDLAVGETTSTKFLDVRSGDLAIARLSITESVDIRGAFSLTNVQRGEVGGTFAIGESLSVGTNIDVGSNIVFRNALDPAGLSAWRIGLKRPYADRPGLADLVLESSDTTEVRFTQDFAPGVMNFTGSHTAAHAISAGDLADCVGKIVVASGSFEGLDGSPDIDIDEAVPVVRLSRDAFDQAVFGVVAAVDYDAPEHLFRLGNLSFAKKKSRLGSRVRVNSAGEGGVLVCDANGALRNGDLIVSSHVPGIGMRQTDNAVRNYTVAKITQDCEFESAAARSVEHRGAVLRVQLVGCTYKM